MERCSTSLAIRKMQIRVRKYTLTPLQILARVWKNWNPHGLLLGMEVVRPLWKRCGRSSKASTQSPRLSNSTPSCVPTRNESVRQHRNSHTDAHWDIIGNSLKGERSNVYQLMREHRGTHTREYYLAIKGYEVLTNSMLIEINQTQKDRYSLIPCIRGI